MNGWTGELDTSEHRAIGEALARAARGIADELSRDRA
jgi:hypothetical protein